MQSEHQVPIWFFIGALLVVYGVLITGAGVYALFFPPPAEQQVVLFEYHADVWWGIVLTVMGAFYAIRFRPGRPGQ